MIEPPVAGSSVDGIGVDGKGHCDDMVGSDAGYNIGIGDIRRAAVVVDSSDVIAAIRGDADRGRAIVAHGLAGRIHRRRGPQRPRH